MISKRSFLTGSAAAALSFGIPIGPIEARFPRGASTANPKTGIGEGDVNGISFAFANLFKVGELFAGTQGVAFNTIMDSNGYPLTTPVGSAAYSFQGTFDPIFYGPTMEIVWTGLGGGQLTIFGTTITVLTDPNNVTTGGPGAYTDRLVLRGTAGDITFTMAQTAAGIPTGGYSWAFTDFFSTITYNGTMGGLACFRASDKAAWTANPYALLPAFKALHAALGERELRTMDWTRVNGSNVTSNAYAMPATMVCFNSGLYPAGMWAGTTSGSSAFTCSNSATPITLTDGATIQVQFTAAAPAATAVTAVSNNGGAIQLTLSGGTSGLTAGPCNYGGYTASTGSVAFGIYAFTIDNGTQITLTGSTYVAPTSASGTISFATLKVGSLAAAALSTGTLGPLTSNYWQGIATTATLVYDGWLNTWIISDFGAASGQNSGGALNAGWPLSVLVNLVNQLNVPIWHFNFPLNYSDASVTADIAYIASNLNSNIQLAVEISNEVWNDLLGSQFFVALYRGWYLGFPNVSNQTEEGYYAYRCRYVHGLVTSAWSSAGRAASGLSRCIAFWGGDPAPSTSASYMLSGADLASVANGGQGNANWIAKTSNANYTTAGSRPVDFCDEIAYATYYNGATITDQGLNPSANALELSLLQTAVAAFDAGNTTAAFGWYDNDIRQGTVNTCQCSLPSAISANTINVTNTLSSTINGQIIIMSSSGAMPTSLTSGTIYYAVNITSSSFQVSATNGGSPLSISGGTGTLTIGSLGNSTKLWIKIRMIPGWEAVAESFDTTRAGQGMAPLKIRQYEGGSQSLAPNLPQLVSASLSQTSTVTFNAGSSPGVSWASSPLKNGDLVGFENNLGTLTSGGNGLLNFANGSTYFVTNASSSGFDISSTYNNPYAPQALTIAGAASGAVTGIGSKYSCNNLLEGWKNSSFGYQFVRDVYTDFMTVTGSGGSGIGGNHSDLWMWFALQGFGQWSALSSSFLSSEYQLFQAMADINAGH